MLATQSHIKIYYHQLVHVPSCLSFIQNHILCSDTIPVRNVYTEYFEILEKDLDWSLQKVTEAVKIILCLGLVVWFKLLSFHIVHWSQKDNIKMQKFTESITQEKQGTTESWDPGIYLTMKSTTNLSSSIHPYWKRVLFQFLIQ